MSTETSTTSFFSAAGWWTTCVALATYALYGGFSSETFLGFFTCGLAAALCAPPVQDRLRAQLGMELAPRKFKVAATLLVVLSLLFMAAGTLAMQDEAAQQLAEERAQAAAAADAKFQAEKAAAVARISSLRDAGRHEAALTEIARYSAMSSDPVLKQLKTSVEAAARQAEVATCLATLGDKQAQYAALFQQEKFDEAADLLKRCAELVGTPELSAQVTAALAQPYVLTLENKTTSLFEKQIALEQLGKVSMAKAREYGKAVHDLEVREAERAAKAERKRKKSEGVRLGMSKEDVLASSWGAPETINRTTTTHGTREQWVYSGYHNYLYFQDGVLVSIQN